MRRIAVMFDRFGPYHVARLAAAAQRLHITGIEVFGESAEYAWDRVDTQGRFDCVTLLPAAHAGNTSASRVRTAVETALDRLSPEVVVLPGWSHAAALAGLAWSVRQRVPAVVLSESNAWDEQRTAAREWVKRRIVGRYAAALVGGEPHREYLEALGLPRERIELGYDAVDNDYFAREARLVRAGADEWRARLRVPKHFFLASARFVAKKNLDGLLRAFAAYRSMANEGHPAWDLVLLGDGELKDSLLRLRDSLRVRDSVHLPGFVQYDRLPAYYGLAGAFVHASRIEQWGLVVNEAMASGLPVVVTRSCGCASSLVVDGSNGWTVDAKETDALAQRLRELAEMPDPQRMQLGANSERIVSQWGPVRFAVGLEAAVNRALQTGVPRTRWLDRAVLRAVEARQ